MGTQQDLLYAQHISGKNTSSSARKITPLDWNAVVPKKGAYIGESRVDHVRRHNVNDLGKPSHGIFNGDGVAITNRAWTVAQIMGLKPDSNGELIVPYKNAGMTGGYLNNNPQQLNSVKIVVVPGTSKIITAYPVK
jgi:hypothetical protein